MTTVKTTTGATATKITGLTGLQVMAIRQAKEEGFLPEAITIQKTTATFLGTPAEALQAVGQAKAGLARAHGSRRHPVASFHAVVRKVAAQTIV